MIFKRVVTNVTFFVLVSVLGSHALAQTAATIIWDFGDVLGEQPWSNVFWEIGPRKFIFTNPLHVQRDFFEFLKTVEPYNPAMVHACHDDIPLPQIMCDWLRGVRTPQEIKMMVTAKLAAVRSKIGKSKAHLWAAIADFMFTSERLARVMVPIKESVKILKKCYEQRKVGGGRLHKLYLLTNFDKGTFEVLMYHKKFRKIFNYFDGIIVSGEIHLIKPDPAIYEYAFETFNIDPNNEFTIYIDNEKAAIDTMMKLGKKQLRCIHFRSAHDLHSKFKWLGIY